MNFSIHDTAFSLIPVSGCANNFFPRVALFVNIHQLGFFRVHTLEIRILQYMYIMIRIFPELPRVPSDFASGLLFLYLKNVACPRCVPKLDVDAL